VLVNGSRVKAMRTRFQVEWRSDEATLLRAFPETGRTHQIRLHLAHLGHPLIGDARYGGPALWRGELAPHHLLHAERLSLPHPRDGEILDITSPAPEWANEL
jgi:23S rRNA pseudouridine1911/1915/1917 synthase